MTPSKYETIVADISQRIASGQLTVSSKLPSIRQLSQTYACSKDTVQRALMELRHRKLIYPVHKSGYYVLEKPEPDKSLPLPASGIDSPAYEDFRLCLDETLVGRESYLFNYYHKQEGLEDLIQSAHQLLVASDIYSKPDQLIITSGSQQALYILSRMTFPGDPQEILLEQPTYHRMNTLVKAQNLPFQTIERSWAGLDFDKLETFFKTGRIKFFYTIPRLHNPLGTALSEADKQQLADLAGRYGVYIIEDDYLADLDARHRPPIHYYDTSQRLIYLKSFSASIFPALRLAAVVLPKPLVKPFLRYKQLMDYDTSLILQKALSLYIDNGMFDKNRLALRRDLLHKQAENQALIEASRLTLPHQLLRQQAIFRLENPQLFPALKQQLDKPDFLAPNYIGSCPQTYLRAKNRQELEAVLKLLT